MACPNALCPHCGQPVLRAVTAAGRRQLLNPQPDPAGNVAACCDGVGTWRARVPSVDRPKETFEHTYMPHAATCSQWPPRTAPSVRVQPAPTRTGPLPDNVVSLDARRRARRPQ
jgi:hypothetical protein